MKKVKKIAAITLPTVTILAGLGWYMVNRSSTAAAGAGDMTVEQHQQQLRAYAEQGRQTMKKFDAVAVPRKSVTLRDVATMDSRLIALSPDEVVWMRNHYYPTEAQLKSVESMSLDGLAGTEDPMLGTLYGMALVARGDSAGGIAVLNAAAARGSIFAYQQAAVAEYEMLTKRLGENREIKNVLRAKLEVAGNMGDYRSDDLASKYLTAYNADANSAVVLAQVSEFTRQLGESAQTMGVQAPGPEPRPNESQWRDMTALAKAGGDMDVDIYLP